jgi:hypothetical protein
MLYLTLINNAINAYEKKGYSKGIITLDFNTHKLFEKEFLDHLNKLNPDSLKDIKLLEKIKEEFSFSKYRGYTIDILYGTTNDNIIISIKPKKND